MTTNLLDTATILLTVAALFGLLNHHVFRLPFTIALVIAAFASSLTVLALDALVPSLGLGEAVRSMVLQVDFTEATCGRTQSAEDDATAAAKQMAKSAAVSITSAANLV